MQRKEIPPIMSKENGGKIISIDPKEKPIILKKV